MHQRRGREISSLEVQITREVGSLTCVSPSAVRPPTQCVIPVCLIGTRLAAWTNNPAMHRRLYNGKSIACHTFALPRLPSPRIEQDTGRHGEGLCEALDDGDGGVADAAFDAADIGAVEATLEGEILLGPAPVVPQFLDVEPELPPDIHEVISGASAADRTTADESQNGLTSGPRASVAVGHGTHGTRDIDQGHQHPDRGDRRGGRCLGADPRLGRSSGAFPALCR